MFVENERQCPDVVGRGVSLLCIVRTNTWPVIVDNHAKIALLIPGSFQTHIRTSDELRGDQYTYLAVTAREKFIVSYLTGKRNYSNTDDFVADVAEPRMIFWTSADGIVNSRLMAVES